ncbi:MAG: ankyrin repeat domain-containing protein [Sphingomonas sp.]|uniref:ankyrin repeat domain-containing protein n=1 Tax=Sphingomonas sp. TaxID=28214 RepID=UPI0025DD0CCB|nr:ankyrin repeat domain-containing protein [Sphingomonas sp.]MBX9880635.1 ankyrin repeat domain-containing protein [Sphingomonas sp.]
MRKMLGLMLLLASAPAMAQLGQSDGYKFLEAVKDAKGAEATELLTKPGTTVINHKDYNSGETALHIVAKRGDALWTRFLLQKGADPNARDGRGNTPMLVAITVGASDLVPILIAGKANVNLANQSGETPLIRAVQRRDVQLVGVLLKAGANPDQPDNLAGRSARDYAIDDKRYPQLAEAFKDVPKRSSRGVAGPTP